MRGEDLRTRKSQRHERRPIVNSRRKRAQRQGGILFSVLALAVFVTGCAGRKPVAASAPPPMAPAATPPATAERAKRSTNMDTRTGDQPVTGGYIEEGNASWYGAPFHGRRASNGETYDMNKMTAAHRTMAFGTIVKVKNLTNGKTAVVRITDRGPFGFFTVQVGAFKEKGNAERLRARLDELYPPSTIQQVALEEATFYRVRAGKVSGEQAAQKFADELKAKEGFHTMVIRLDEAPAGGDQ